MYLTDHGRSSRKVIEGERDKLVRRATSTLTERVRRVLHKGAKQDHGVIEGEPDKLVRRAHVDAD
ncbi:MAG TPA: hypothetical protein VLW50_08270 [Streptosporangiaceae bacterium]|nr:hypothetical protein [Streptosporangiaceae bacterium]